MIRSVRRDWWLNKLFQHDAVLAKQWLLAKIDCDQNHSYTSEKAFVAACAVLSPAARVDVVNRIDGGNGLHGAARAIVGNDPVVYAALLAREQLKRFHLRPLDRSVDQVWRTLALEAFKFGFSPEDVAAATHTSSGWSNSLAAHSRELAGEWARMLHDKDERIRRAAELGHQSELELAKREAEREERDERDLFDR